MYDIIVIGAGPAGLTAALNALRAERTVLILEGDGVGGQIALSPKVENFPTVQASSGSELMDKLFDQVSNWGGELELDKATKVIKNADNTFTVVGEFAEYQGKSIIVATGASHRHIGVDREEDLIGHGVSYCAICDGAFFSGEEVAVIGDANTALQYAILLTNYCKTVHVCTLFDKFFADKILVNTLLKKENVKIYHNLALQEFKGDPELTGLRFENTQDKSEFNLDCKAAFICIGQIPANDCVKDLVNINKQGYIIADELCKTNVDGIFVAGDCRTKEIRQLVTATADGSTAAFFACQYLDAIEA